MYIVLTTFPQHGSANVGDKLIEARLQSIIEHEKGERAFVSIFREEPLEPMLDQINRARAVLMPALAVRDLPMYPGCYRLVEDLSRIEVPLIPVGANWNVYPGDAFSRRTLEYSEATQAFLKRIAAQVDAFSCREFHACRVLARHGITNALMTGDPAWFDLAHLERPMHRPSRVERVVFSPPMSPQYAEQALHLMQMLAALFPDATRYCSMHVSDRDTQANARAENSAAMSPEVTEKNRKVRAWAEELGFEVRHAAGELANLDYYETCDLHVGYECHAHARFISLRRPSILIAEDARGVGFNDTLGVGGFTGFQRVAWPVEAVRKSHTSGYCTTLAEFSLAPAHLDVHEDVREFLEDELATGFNRFAGLGPYLDRLYNETMAPFIRSLP